MNKLIFLFLACLSCTKVDPGIYCDLHNTFESSNTSTTFSYLIDNPDWFISSDSEQVVLYSNCDEHVNVVEKYQLENDSIYVWLIEDEIIAINNHNFIGWYKVEVSQDGIELTRELGHDFEQNITSGLIFKNCD